MLSTGQGGSNDQSEEDNEDSRSGMETNEEESATDETTKSNNKNEKFRDLSPITEEDPGEDVTTHVVGKKPLRGKLYKDANGEYNRYRCFSLGRWTEYKPGDAVYMESQRPDLPYYICVIQELKMSKRDTLNIHIKWFYRTSEVPEQIYQLLVQDRHTEHGVSSKKAEFFNDPMIRMRELFISDATDVYPVSVLRGKCKVLHFTDLEAGFKDFKPETDTFFYTLSYNPETRRLATTQGEIRVGESHQAKLPKFEGNLPIEERPTPLEELAWSPGRIHDHDLLMYLRASRSVAAFAAMCDGGNSEDGYMAASRDGITANAISMLHESEYDAGKALQSLLKCPYPAEVQQKWPEEDVRNFIKGLRMYGKNFFKIRTEFLPEKETSDLIEFYYLWKKTPGAANNRPRGRRPRPNVIRRIKGNKSKTAKEDPTDLGSASEVDEDGHEDGLSPYYCRHCFTTSSKDWHHAGKEKLLLCTDCRLFWKKYGEFPPLDLPLKKPARTPTPTEPKKESPAPSVSSQSSDDKQINDEININAIEQDSLKQEPVVADSKGPMEIKGELPKSMPLHGIVSPVPTMPATHHIHKVEQGPASANSDIQVLSESLPPAHHHPPVVRPQPSPIQTPQPPPIQTPPSPPPKPDGAECHRSQSAIFTRVWNRGEGNSCSRTDMTFKPVPDSKLAKKREERMRKANEKEEQRAASEAAAKMARQDFPPGGMFHHPGVDPFGRSTPSAPPPVSVRSPFHPPPGFGLGSPGQLSDMERMELERRDIEKREEIMRMSMARGPPQGMGDPYLDSIRAAMAASGYPPGLFNESRRLEEMAALRSAERQYAERMNALATDPLVRLQMAGVTPEIPSGLGAPRGYPPGFPPGMQAALGFGRPPGAEQMLMRSPYPNLIPGFGGGPPPPDVLQRQLLLERELAAHGAHAQQQASLMAQQEEFLRQHEARQRAGRP